MRKIMVLILATATLIMLSCIDAYALESNIDQYFDEQLSSSGADELIDELPSETKEILYNLGADEIKVDSLLSLEPGDFFSTLFEIIKEKATRPLRICCTVIGIILIYSMLDSLKTSALSDTMSRSFSTAAVLCTATVLIFPVSQLIDDCSKTVDSCSIFLNAYIPAFAALLIFSSAGFSSAVYSSLLFGASQAVSGFAKNVIIPLVIIYFAISLICALSPAINFKSLSDCLSKTATWSLGLIMTVYVGLMTIQGAVGASADSLTLKSAKFFASSTLPVVGGAVSEAMSSVFTGLSLVKTSVGSIGIIIIIATFLPALLELLCWRLLLGFSNAVGDIMGCDKIGSLLKSASTAISIIMAVIACYALIIIICTALMLKTSSGI